MSIEQIKLSQSGKDQLVRLKRKTGVKNWNVLCRWGFCRSLAEASMPSPVPIPSDSSVEMTWKTFGGPQAAVYMALLKQRCHDDGLELTDESLNTNFRLHLHRGIAYLAGDKTLQRIEDMAQVALSTAE